MAKGERVVPTAAEPQHTTQAQWQEIKSTEAPEAAAVEDRVDGPKRARKQRHGPVDRLSSLPQPLLESIVGSLTLKDMWSLWRCNRVLRTAVRRLQQWKGLATLGVAQWMARAQPFQGLVALRMLAPGVVTRITLLHEVLVGEPACGEPSRCRDYDTYDYGFGYDHGYGYHPRRRPHPGVDDDGRETADRRAARCALECLLLHVPHVTELRLNCRLSNDSVCYCDDRPCFHTTPTSRTVPPFPHKPKLEAFTSLKALVTSCERVKADNFAPLTALTSLHLYDKPTDGLLQAVLKLPSLTELIIDRVEELSLSAATLQETSCLQRLELINCSWRGSVPAWLAHAMPLASLQINADSIDLSLLSSLPRLRSASLDLNHILEPNTPAGTHSITRSSTGGPASATWSLSQLTSLTVKTSNGGKLPLCAFSGLRELWVDLEEGLSLEGPLACMPLLTSLHAEAWGGMDIRAIDMRELCSLTQLRNLTLRPTAVQEPYAFAALGHIESVLIEDCLGAEEEAGLTVLTQATGLRSLTLTTPDPIRAGTYLDGVTCLTRLCLNDHDDRYWDWDLPLDTLRKTWQFGEGYAGLRSLKVNFPADVTGHLAVRCELPQLTELDLTGFVAVEREWAWLLPNLVKARILDLEAKALPDLEKGGWPRLLRLEVGGTQLRTLPWSWLSLPSLRTLSVVGCKKLPTLPDIPKLSPARRAPLRELRLVSCPELGVLPLTFSRLQELQLVVVQGCDRVRVPKGLRSSRLRVMLQPQ